MSKTVAKKKGIPAREPSAGKADIFTRRVLQPQARPTSAATAKDALVASLNERGAVDMDYMISLYGKDAATIAAELGELVFVDPKAGWVQADEYLSGNVKAKLAEAREAAKADPQLERNVSALEAVQPKDVPPLEIAVRLGSPWVPGTDIAEFGQSLIGGTARASFVPAVARWGFEVTNANAVANQTTWGTPRRTGEKLIHDLLNRNPIIIKDNIGSSKEPHWVINEEATRAAQARALEIEQAFAKWIWSDAERRDRLAKTYNESYNTERERKIDGQHLVLPGMNPAITLRKHQKDGIWRNVTEPNVLLDHVVGAGKTYVMTGGAMERRRLGHSRKPMFTVPNHLVTQWRDEFYKLYPNASILSTTEKDFQKANRKRLFARIATGDWDAVIVAHSSFKKIGMPHVEQQAILGEMLADIAGAIEEIKREKGDRHVLRDMERIKKNLMAKLAKLAHTGTKDDTVTFDELGVDALYVDEAHLFKNLFYFSQMKSVAGLGNPSGSGRAFDMFVKTRFLQARGGATVFATGTPVSNSLVEMFTMQRFLDYPNLRARNIHLLDAWAGVFGSVEQVYEVHPSGNGYRLATRFAKFTNLAELMRMYKGFADVITMGDLKQQARDIGQRFPVPKAKTGKPILHAAERSDLQRDFFGVAEFQIDQDGEILFERPGKPSDWTVIEQDGKWHIARRFEDESTAASAEPQAYDTEREARDALDIGLRTPHVGYNANSILWKYENLRNLIRSSNGKINALSITNEARKAGLDYRLIDPAAPDVPTSKVNIAVGEVRRIYDEWAEDRGTQLVFLDLSVPSSARKRVQADIDAKLAKEAAESLENEPDATEAPDEEERADAMAEEEEEELNLDQVLALQSKFSVYDDFRAKLIASGIPENEIAFIHDYDTSVKKQALFTEVREGRKRILMGSTDKMGPGMNVQTRLVAVHHLDSPWKPSDLEQRNGRIYRQGNELYERDPDGFEVEEHRYSTKQTYDTRMWQIIEHKANGIEQLRKAGADLRTIEDISGEAATAADMKAAASGNPLILDEIRLRNEVRNLEAQFASYQRAKFELESEDKWLSEAPKRAEAKKADIRPWIAARKPAEPFAITVGDKAYTEKKAAHEALMARVKEIAEGPVKLEHQLIGEYRGFVVRMQRAPWGLSPDFHRPGKKSDTRAVAAYTSDDKFSASGFITRLDNAMEAFDTQMGAADKLAAEQLAKRPEVQAAIAKPFAKEADLTEARQRHREIADRLRATGGAVSLTPEMRAELTAALKKRGIDAPLMSRGPGIPGISLSADDVRAFVKPIVARWKNAPRVKVVANASFLPAKLYSVGAEFDVRGVYDPDSNTVYLVASNLESLEEAEFTLFHEAKGHAGLRGLFGADLNRALIALATRNAPLRAAARTLRENFNYDTHRALEEALADMAGQGVTLNGWDRFIARVQELLRRIGLERIANWMEGKTQAETLAVLTRAARVVTEGSQGRPAATISTGQWPRPGEDREAGPPLYSRAVPSPAPRAAISAPASRGVIDPILRMAGGSLLARITGPAYDRALAFLGELVPEKVKAGLIADYGMPAAVVERRQDTYARIQASHRETATFVERLAGLDRAQSRVAYAWMTTAEPGVADRLLEQLPDEAQATLRELKTLINRMGVEAVELDMISRESYERNLNAYLHRTFYKHELGETATDRIKRARSIRILGDQFKGRGLRDDVAMDKIKWPEGEMGIKRRADGSVDPGLKGKKFTRYELRARQPDEETLTLPGIDEAELKAGKLRKVEYWPTEFPPPAKYADWTDAGTWEARWFDRDSVGMWRDFTPEELLRMGEIQEVKYSVAKTLMNSAHDLEIARYFEWLAREHSKLIPTADMHIVDASDALTRSYTPNEWVRVPETVIPKTAGAKVYGALAGRYVQGSIWNDIRQIARVDYRPLGETYDAILRWWKVNKTARSPVVHFNNVMANFMMADLHDVGARDLYEALQVWQGREKDEEAKATFREFEDSGATLGMFVSHELKRETLEPLLADLRRDLEQAEGSPAAMVKIANVISLITRGQVREAIAAAAQTTAFDKVRKLDERLVKWYENEDSIFRLAAFIKARKEGQSIQDAGRFARKSFLDYEINAPWIQMARRTGFPFIGFTYRAIPMMLDAIANKPWKLAKYALMASTLNSLAYSALGMGDDDEERERAMLPEEKAGRVWGLVPKLMRMPWNDEHGNPVFLDVRRWLVLGDILDIGARDTALPMTPALVPGGPLAFVAEFMLNRQSFTGKPITKETDTSLEAVKNVGDWLFKAFAPNAPWIPKSWSADALLDAGTGKTDVFGREQDISLAIASAIGVKLSAYPPDVLQYNRAVEHSIRQNELTSRIRSVARQQSRKAISDAAAAAEIEELAERKKRLAEEFVKRGGAVLVVPEAVQ